MYRAVLTLAWFAGTIYATIPLFSLVVRPLAKLLRARVHSPLLVVIPSWFIMMAVIYFMTWRWREAVLYHAPLAWVASVLLFGTAIVIYRRSHSASRTFHSWAAVDAILARGGGLSLQGSVNKSGIPSIWRICACCSPGQWARVELCCTDSLSALC